MKLHAKQQETQLIAPSNSNKVIVQPSGIMPPYMLLPAEPTLNVDIYLPKKDIFQGVLHDTLRQGLNVDAVKNHFSNCDIQVGLKNYLRKRKILPIYTEETIHNFPSIFGGYSLFEGDGMFAGIGARAYNERTQVVKLMFRPNMDKIKQKCPDQNQVFALMKKVTLNNYFEVNEGELGDTIDDGSYELRTWESYIWLFVFGYIVYNICQHIHDVSLLGFDDVEEEIWVTSNGSTLLHRIVNDPVSN
jgi:hypothetical protein